MGALDNELIKRALMGAGNVFGGPQGAQGLMALLGKFGGGSPAPAKLPPIVSPMASHTPIAPNMTAAPGPGTALPPSPGGGGVPPWLKQMASAKSAPMGGPSGPPPMPTPPPSPKMAMGQPAPSEAGFGVDVGSMKPFGPPSGTVPGGGIPSPKPPMPPQIPTGNLGDVGGQMPIEPPPLEALGDQEQLPLPTSGQLPNFAALAGGSPQGMPSGPDHNKMARILRMIAGLR